MMIMFGAIGSHHKIFFSFLLVAVAFLLYIPTFNAEFHFDDNAYLLESSEIIDISGCLTSLGNHFFRPDRMLVTLSFAVNYAVHGFALPGYHFINILLHGLNGVLLFLLLQHLIAGQLEKERRNGGEFVLYTALGGALLFLVHPVAVSSVTYITQRHGLLASFFCFSGFLSYLKARNGLNIRRCIWGLCCVVCYWAAIHSKPMALVFPLFLISYEIILVRREQFSFRRLLIWSMPVFALFSVALFAYAFQSGLFSEGTSLAGFSSEQLWSPWHHFLTESQVFLHYWKILFLPLPNWLSGDHYFPVVQSINSAVMFSWLAHIFILLIGLWAYYRNMRLITFGILWFYIALVPPYLLLPIQDVMVDYKTYLPAAGLVFIIVEVGRYFFGRFDFRIVAGCFCMIILLGCWSTIERNRVFTTEVTFWTDVIDKYPHQARPYNNRGLAYHKNGLYHLAIADYNNALSIRPDSGLVHANIGDSYREVGEMDSAVNHYRQHIQMYPKDADGLIRLANIYARQGKWETAVKMYTRAVESEPENIDALYNLGLGYGHLRNFDLALNTFGQAIKLQPNNFQILASIGAIYYQNGNREKAKEFFEKSLAFEPKFADALYNLAACYIGEGNLPEAKSIILRLSKVDPARARKLLHYLEGRK